MKTFESFLAPRFEAYIDYRMQMGYAHRCIRSNLLTFDRYLVKQNAGWQSITPAFLLALRAELKTQPRTTNTVFFGIKSFFTFLIRQGDLRHNPVENIPFLAQRAFIPFIFTPRQTDQLLAALANRLRKSPEHYLSDLAVYTALCLIARCGLRIAEPIGLKGRNLVKEDQTIYIEKTKFRKYRLIAIPAAVTSQVENYLAVRKALICHDQSEYLLIASNHAAISMSRIYRLFHLAVKDIGIVAPRQIIGDVIFGSPTVHSLRHSFAINTLKRIKDRGDSVQHALPVLAAYMGHCKYRYTGTYLKVLCADQRQGLVEFAKARMRPP